MYVVLAVGGLILLAFVTWRLASRRHAIPCPVWLSWLVELDNPFAKTNRAAFIVEHLNLAPGMTVLDAGCGPGRLTIPLARAVGGQGEVVALDLQAGMLERVREKVEAEGLANIRLLQAGLGEGALEQGKFDRAVLVTVLGEIPEREPALNEVFDALKPGGILSVTELVFDPHFQRHSTVKRLAESVGFREGAFYGSGIAYTVHFQKP
jgi:ubiquinone/menaquinone biosynthesis C-methylase UbiE